MPLYDYECSACKHAKTDVEQSVKEKPFEYCVRCGQKTFERIIHSPMVFVKNVSTIGQLSDKNARENKNKISEAEAKKRESTPEAPKTWYDKHGTATPKEINKMTPQQKTRYIMEGRK